MADVPDDALPRVEDERLSLWLCEHTNEVQVIPDPDNECVQVEPRLRRHACRVRAFCEVCDLLGVALVDDVNTGHIDLVWLEDVAGSSKWMVAWVMP